INGNNIPDYAGYANYTVTDSGTLYINYSVSSDTGDMADIALTFASQGPIDGNNSSSLALPVTYGDLIQFNYTKNGSGNAGTDSAHFEVVFCSNV
ncbi:hypothetical protein EB001_24245, partial [bacterium]|nr:hypothetical protein [bacterium]